MEQKPKTLAECYPTFRSDKPKSVVFIEGSKAKASDVLTDAELDEAISILMAEYKKRHGSGK